MKRMTLVVACLALTLLEALLAAPAHAIPAWSRRYKEPKTDCLSCHTWGSWKLNKRGQDFMRYGHHFEGDKAEGLGLSEYMSLASKIPLHRAATRSWRASIRRRSRSTPAARWARASAIFIEVYLHDTTGRNTGASDFGDFGRTKLAESVLQYTHGPESRYFTARVGQILPQLLHVNGMGARTSAVRANLWTRSSINPANAYQPFSRQYGLDVAYHAFASNAVVGLVNGTGSAAQRRSTTTSTRTSTSRWTTPSTSGARTSGCSTTTGVSRSAKAPTTYPDRFHRWIGVGDFSRAHFNAKAAVVTGDGTTSTRPGNRATGNGYYLEGYYYPVKWAGVFGRYERWDPNKAVDGDHSDGVTGGFTVHAVRVRADRG